VAFERREQTERRDAFAVVLEPPEDVQRLVEQGDGPGRVRLCQREGLGVEAACNEGGLSEPLCIGERMFGELESFGATVAPRPDVDAETVRAAYAAFRRRSHPEAGDAP
jgi:hypothetical protein